MIVLFKVVEWSPHINSSLYLSEKDKNFWKIEINKNGKISWSLGVFTSENSCKKQIEREKRNI